MNKLLIFCLLLSSSFSYGFGVDKLGINKIGARFGYVKPKNWDGTFGLGVFLPLGEIHENVEVGFGFDVWSSSEEKYNIEVDLTDYIFRTYGQYNFNQYKITDTIVPYAGGGIALHFISAEVASRILGTTIKVDANDTELGLDMFVGTRIGINEKFETFVEMKYALVSEIGQLSIMSGILYSF